MTGARAQGVLLTGFPGALSRSLLRQLLADESGPEVFVLAEAAQATIADDFAQGCRGGRSRFRLVEGNAHAMDFGLSGREFCDLAQRVEVIQHAAGTLDPKASLSRSTSLNVGGTREVLEFAMVAPNLSRLMFFSSASVSGDRVGKVLESELQQGQRFRTPAEETMALAERMVQGRISQLPITIVRPSLLAIETETGEVERDNPLAALISTLVHTPIELPLVMPGRGDVALNLVPIDFVAQVAFRILAQSGTTSKVFHVTDPNPPTVERIFELVSAVQGRRVRPQALPDQVSKALLGASSTFSASLLRGASAEPWAGLSWTQTPRVLLDLMTTRVCYDARNTEAVLGSALSELPGPEGAALESGAAAHSGGHHGVPRCPAFESYVERMVTTLLLRRKRSQDGKNT